MFRTLLALLICLATPSLAQVEVVTERKPTRVTVYLSMPLATVPEILGVTLPLTQSEQNAADLIPGLTLRTLDGPLELTPIAAVLHPSADPIDFSAPWDASIAVDFGGQSQTFDPSIPLTLYARLEARAVDGYQVLSFSFPNSTGPAVELVLHDYVRDQVRDRIVVQLDEGGVILLPEVFASTNGIRWTIAFGFVFLATLGYDLWRRRRKT